MPDMGGAELARRMAREQPDLRVLYMSGYADESIVRHGVLERDVEFVKKPITPHLLMHKVRAALDRPARS